MHLDTNFQKNAGCEFSNSKVSSSNVIVPTNMTSILKVKIGSINLHHFRQKSENRRSIMNRPDLNIILETVREVKDVNPKSMHSLNVKLDNCRLSLSLRDVLSLYSVVSHQQEMARRSES